MNLRINKKREIKQQSLLSEEDKLKKKRKRKSPPKGSRWTIIIAFFLTLGIIAAFYLQAEFPSFWQKLTSPLIISNLSQEERFNAGPVLSEVENLTKNLRGNYGIYVFRLEDKKEYGFNQKKIFPAASLMKLPVLLALYQKAEAGEVDLATKYILKEKDKKTGAGLLQNKEAGSAYTYRELAELMGQHSDNTAFAVIRGVLTDEEIEKTIVDLGMKDTSLRDFETTPEDMGIFFQKLYQGNILKDKNRDEILSFLTETAFEDWIPQGVPEEVSVSHKIGQDLGTFSDAAVVFSSRPFIIVIMSKNAREKEADEVIPEITSLIWNFENK